MHIRKPINPKNRLLAAFLFVAVFGMAVFVAPSTALAHKVNVFAYVEGDTVITESYFSDGRKCRDCIVDVLDDKGKKLLEGKTDEEGRFSFRPPVRTKLLIRLRASMGHLAEYSIPATDLPQIFPAAATGTAGELPKSQLDRAVSPQPSTANVEPPTQAASEASEIEKTVDRSIARQLEPIRRALEEDRNKQRFSDIVGGIGYIIGLMGLAAYFRSKLRQKRG
jgi:nickel transport protein